MESSALKVVECLTYDSQEGKMTFIYDSYIDFVRQGVYSMEYLYQASNLSKNQTKT